MAQKPSLHELLKEDQEPFRLTTYIADRRSQLNKPSPSTALPLRKHRPPSAPTNRGVSALGKHSCFLSFPNSPDVRRSPLFDFPSQAKSPCRSPNDAVFLHVPSRTAALLVEAAMRIHKQQKSRNKAHSARNVGLGLFGTFLKRLKEHNRSKTRGIETATLVEEDSRKIGNANRLSCSCGNRRVSSVNSTENIEDKSLDLEASISGHGFECSNSDFVSMETRFCHSPFVFSLERSPPPSPDFCSRPPSPSLQQNQEKENYKSRNSENVVEGEEEEDKDQFSPVSVLEPPYGGEDDERESREADADDYELECSYKNVQRVRQHLLYRLQRFEKLAALDTTELERNLLEGSEDEDLMEMNESDGDERLSMYKKQIVEKILTQVFYQSSLGCHRITSPDMMRLVYDLIVEENGEIVFMGNNEVSISRICRKLESWEEVELNTIDMMVGLDFKGEFGRWTKFDEQLRDISAKIEISICGLLVEELSNELLNMGGKY